MGNKNQNIARVYKEIQSIFLQIWDPIGIGDCKDAQDEYDSYIGQIYALLLKNPDTKSVDDLLSSIEIDRMGLSSRNPRRPEAVSALLIISL